MPAPLSPCICWKTVLVIDIVLANIYSPAPFAAEVQLKKTHSSTITSYEYYRSIPPLAEACILLNVLPFTTSPLSNVQNTAEPKFAFALFKLHWFMLISLSIEKIAPPASVTSTFSNSQLVMLAILFYVAKIKPPFLPD